MTTQAPKVAAFLALCWLLGACTTQATADSGTPDAAMPVPDAGPADGGRVDAGPLLHVASPAWEDQVIYFILTDRFANGDPANDDQDAGEFDPTDKDKYSGGDLAGIVQQLDYIQGLGATAIWITPPVANMWFDPEQRSGGYHGYWARNLKKVDEHLGTLAAYQQLSDALHRRGMYLIQDIVPNHMGNFFSYVQCGAGGACSSTYPAACKADYTAPGCDPAQGFHLNSAAVPFARPEQPPFDQNDVNNPAHRAAGIYHWTPQIEDYGNAYQSWFWALSDLDDLNSESPVVRKALRDSYGYWVKNVGVDAFRVDTARYVPHDFWTDFFNSTDPEAPGLFAVARATGRQRFHAFGEIAETSDPFTDGAEQRLKPYFGSAASPEFPALLGYPLFGEINRVFAQGAPTAAMTYRLGKFMDPAVNPAPYLTPTFVDNHDQSRFLNIAGNGNALVEALCFIFTLPGIPTVYYGTEQGFTSTRQSMFDGGYGAIGDAFRPNYGLYKIVKQLADLRAQSPALRRGTLEVLADNPTGPGALVYKRRAGDEQVFVFINSGNSDTLAANVATGLPAGTVLEGLISEPPGFTITPPTVEADGGVTLSLVPRGVLVARATTQIVAPPAPLAVITVATPLEGQTLTADTTITGTVAPPTTKLVLVQDGNLSRAKPITVQADGSWSYTLPVSTFPVGRRPLTLSVYAPMANVSSPVFRLQTDVVFVGRTISVDDPPNDDTGPAGKTYRYPTDSSFNHQMDLTNVTALVGASTLKLQLTMRNVTTVWSPDLGFDHTVFNIFFEVPGQTGLTALPLLQATTPAGFTWSYGQFASGYRADGKLFNAQGASATTQGTVIASPTITTAGKTVTLEYDRNTFAGPAITSWNGVRVYVSTWDYDGVQKIFRPISAAGGPYEVGQGLATDPYVMDDIAPLTLIYP
jgi:glycosidase